MPEPCRPDGGTIQEFIDNLPGRDECCWHMTGVKVKVRYVITREIDLCVPTPDDANTLKYVEGIMELALPLIPNTFPTLGGSPIVLGDVYEVQSVTSSWMITESFT